MLSSHPHPTNNDSTESWIDLSRFDNADYDPGRGLWIRLVWYYVSLVVFESGWLPASGPKRWLLRAFGARVGIGVVIKPHVRIKYPWRLKVGDHCWIGQSVWIDNLADVVLGDHVCLSQKTYFCTGSHDHKRPTFDLITQPITIGNGCWIAAGATLLGGVHVASNAVVAAGSVVTADVAAATIVAGIPARPVSQNRTKAA